MHARYRASVMLCILALVAFLVRWPVDDYTCNPKTWSIRPPEGESTSFFNTVFRGGGGTPAIFAMLGGQRYLVANILWNYSDVLFHQGKSPEMVPALDSCVTLNPSFVEAWSVYGWHLAWNLNSDAKDLASKKKWLDSGEAVCVRALLANSDKPRPYFDLAWLYIQRVGRYDLALPYLQAVVENKQLHGQQILALDDKRVKFVFPRPVTKFEPLSPEKKAQTIKTGLADLTDSYWDIAIYGRRLAFLYKKLGIIQNNPTYLEQSMATYRLCLANDPKDTASRHNLNTLVKHQLASGQFDQKWLDSERAKEAQYRERFGMSPLDAGKSPSSAFYDDHDGHDDHGMH